MASERAFVGVSALLFVVSAAVTIVWCASMSAMGGMPMPGGWTMSRAWMRMLGQTWPGAAASFLGMWHVMMVAMMLPSLVPMLWRYRKAVGRSGETRLGRLTAFAGVGYFFVWTVFGMAAYPLGVALAALEMQQPALARAVPIAAGVVVLVGGGAPVHPVEGTVRQKSARFKTPALPIDLRRRGAESDAALRAHLNCDMSICRIAERLSVSKVFQPGSGASHEVSVPGLQRRGEAAFVAR